MVTASELAKYIVHKYQEAGDPVTNLKLQKLLYYVQGWHLAMSDNPAFTDRIEAWVHGPVQPGVYGEYKCNRWNPICTEVQPPALDIQTKSITDEVLDIYGGDSGYELEIRTHHEPPWIEARDGIPPDQESTSIISHESMKHFFKRLSEDSHGK
ncbi:MAG: DUF4065 domain-containing protein [Methylophilus sp.]|nr:DUF4065 domain-containing protein [Methylophilus sp.]